MRLEASEAFGVGASFGMNNALCELGDTFDMEHHLVDTPLEGCRDVLMHEGSPSLGSNHVSPNPLEHSHVSTFCSQPSFSPKYAYDMPIHNFEVCDSNVDMGNKDNMLNTLGGKFDSFMSLGYFS